MNQQNRENIWKCKVGTSIERKKEEIKKEKDIIKKKRKEKREKKKIKNGKWINKNRKNIERRRKSKKKIKEEIRKRIHIPSQFVWKCALLFEAVTFSQSNTQKLSDITNKMAALMYKNGRH